MKKINVLYIISNLTKCGPVNILYGIIKNMSNDKFNINILTLSKEKDNSMLNEFKALDINVYDMNISRVGMQIYGKRKFQKIVNKINPDIIHTHGIRAELYSSRYITKNIFTTIHNYPHKDFIMEYGKVLGSYMVNKEIKIIKKISNPIACSKSISEEIKSLFNCDIDYIQNGIDIKKYNKITNLEKISLKNKLGINKNSKIIISVGRLIDRKNPIKIIESFIQSNIKDEYTLIMLGDGNLKEECEKYSCKNILVLGEVSNVSDYLNIADIFISSSKAEGLPNAVLEAMACGLMVILSDINPHKEIIDNNTESGILFDLNNDELVNILNNIHNLDLEFRSLKCREIVEEYFSDVAMSRKYQDKYIKSIRKKEGELSG